MSGSMSGWFVDRVEKLFPCFAGQLLDPKSCKPETPDCIIDHFGFCTAGARTGCSVLKACGLDDLGMGAGARSLNPKPMGLGCQVMCANTRFFRVA